MSIIKYFPRWMDDLNDDVMWPASNGSGLNIHETEKNILIRAVVAGVPSDNVEANIENGVLTIKAEVKEKDESKNGYKSTSYQYYYTTALSGGDWQKAEAEVKHGILTVTIPKAESSLPRKITIKAK